MTDSPIPAERHRHDRITRSAEQVADSNGGIGRPWHVEGLLARLERHGDIGPAERMAGEKFAELFRLAHMDPIHAAGMARSCHAVAAGEPNGVSARERVNRALDALGGLGSPCGTAAWFILGCEMSLQQWAIREGWGGQAGRAVNPQVAKGVLIGTLGTLTAHFGLD